MGPKEIQHLLGHSDPPAGEMIRRLLADNQRMADRQFAAIEMCDSRGDTPNGNMLQDVLDQTQRFTRRPSLLRPRLNGLLPRYRPAFGPGSFSPASAFCSQNPKSISRYILAAVIRCS